MKFKTKLILGISSKPIIVLLIIVFGLLQIQNLTKLTELTQHNYEKALLAEQIQKEIKDEAISLRNVVLFTNKASIQKELDHVEMLSERVSQDLTLLESKVNTSEQIDMVHNLKEIIIEFNVYKDKVIELNAKGDKAAAIQMIDNNGHSIHDKLFQEISVFTKHFETNMSASFVDSTKSFKWQIAITSLISLIAIVLSSSYIVRIVWEFANRLSKVSNVMENVANGKADLRTKVEVTSNDEVGEVARSFNTMVLSLAEQRMREQSLLWVKSNIADITTSLSGIQNLETLSQTFLSKAVPLLDSCHAVLYGKEDSSLTLLASYGKMNDKQHPITFKLGEGLIGQAAIEKSPIILTDVPSDYIQIKTGVGERTPLYLSIFPILFEGEVKALLELASFKALTEEQNVLLDEIAKSLGIILESVYGRIRLAQLLQESQMLTEEVQAQSEELQAQQEELRATNEELEEQTQALRQSELTLQYQQEELEQTNKELLEKAAILEEKNKMFELTNREVESAHAELEEQARQIALSSKYKSEFLANMSHELRTPLNSLLILSKLLAENSGGNLTEKQVSFSKTIHSSGRDLLVLINDILDLAKIESGKMRVNPGKVLISDLVEFVENSFRPIADEKNVNFHISLQDDLPLSLISDEQRLQQVLKNLLSNAFKFTNQGEVRLEIGLSSNIVEQPTYVFSVVDTGIGIPDDKQELIFEAFQQADGTTSRRFGGTGLGLSICREIANLLNGEIVVESEQGKGSRFSFYVADFQEEAKEQKQVKPLKEVAVTIESTKVKREEISEPTSVPEKDLTIDGNQPIKRLLIVDDDVRQRNSLMELVGAKNVVIKAVSTGLEAMEELKVSKFDFMILDLGLTDSNGMDLLAKIKTSPDNEKLHVFIYTGRDLSAKEEIHLLKYTNTIIIKDEHSPQRLMDELELYLHSESEKEAENGDVDTADQATVQKELEGKRILLVDDDVRNVYALMSLLETYHMDITFAENGKEGIEILEKGPRFDLVLMDIMMPEMDGYEAIQRIREKPQYSSLPIIALTAKAMKEDREKCIKAGASDYIVKPFDPDQLISLIRVWLYNKK
ncbi:response regulator [Neobacillus citreus]|uniref:Circadian input-output histidine kinase CikA n=1 Tax=Neobacillus citreus TaxID=2833578 RepID=A0A942T0M0_9BACI|nr:response regulator [Neobacillus citreus]MCH6269293.1 response regulator [Neobacillus citreus]